VHAATVALLREGPQGLEVLLLQRHGASPVLGGAHVFPGGKVDPSDEQLLACADQPAALLEAAWHATDAATLGSLRNDHDAPSAMPTNAGGASAYLAAVRETFEEAGLLYARDAMGEARALPTDTVRAARARQRAGKPLMHTLHAMRLRLHTGALIPWSRWISPVHGAVSAQRFDTRFFIAALPPGQQPEVDAHEATQAIWLRPRDALEQYAQGFLALAPPQIMSLVQLLPHREMHVALAAAQARPPVRIQPEAHTDAQGTLMHCYPGDALHREHTHQLLGPTRLLYRNQRFEPEGGYEMLWCL
jgi:8-oxo-dGTP pyrophosphatase MutT (NUDIX family)